MIDSRMQARYRRVGGRRHDLVARRGAAGREPGVRKRRTRCAVGCHAAALCAVHTHGGSAGPGATAAAHGERREVSVCRPNQSRASCASRRRSTTARGRSGAADSIRLSLERRRSGRHRAAARRPVHLEGLLQGPSALERSALLPLQQSGGPRNGARSDHGAYDRGRPAAVGGLGILRSRLPSSGHRKPLFVHDRASALRGVAAGNDTARRSYATYVCDGPHRLERSLRARGPDRALVRAHALQSGLDDLVAADSRVPDADGPGPLPPRRYQRAAVAVDLLLARGFLPALVFRRRESRVSTPIRCWSRRSSSRS